MNYSKLLKAHGLSGNLQKSDNGKYYYRNPKYQINRTVLLAKDDEDAITEVQNKWPVVQVGSQAGRPYSFKQALEDWKQDKKPSDESYGFKEYTWNFFYEATKVSDLKKITAKHVQIFIKKLELDPIKGINRTGKKRTPSTILHRLSACKTVYGLTAKYHGVSVNPFSSMGPTAAEVKAQTVNKRPFTMEEIDLILSNMSGWMRAISAIGKYTAVRFGDAVCMKWEQIDFDNRILKPFVQSKTGRWHNGFEILGDEFWSIINEWREECCRGLYKSSPYIFARKRGQYVTPKTKSYPVSDWGRALRNMGVETYDENGRKNAGFHSFRSYAVTYMRMLDMDDQDIIKFTGHSDIQMLEIYDNPTEEQRMQRAVQLREKIEHFESKFAIKHDNNFSRDLLPDKLLVDPDMLEELALFLKSKIPEDKRSLFVCKFLE